VLTPDIQARIVRALAEGSYLSTACRVAGISADTWYYWRRLCKNGVAHAQVYAGFYGACARERRRRGFGSGGRPVRSARLEGSGLVPGTSEASKNRAIIVKYYA
jgi:hypothetical protein